MKHCRYIILLLVLGCFRYYSQTSLSTKWLTLTPDTLQMGSNYSTTFYLKNESALPYNDSLQYRIGIDSTGIGNSFTSSDTLVQFFTYSLQPGDSSLTTINNLPTAYGKQAVGPNVIVVWPMIGNGSIPDTARTILTVIASPSSILEINSKGEINVYPNPIAQEFGVKLSYDIALESIKLYNSQGAELPLIVANDGYRINHLPSGIYLLYVNTKGKGSHVIRLVKTD
ncbi:MAG: T9SS type A sorting domain-containing protein [Bacteroidetes bacterium]|nr:T9SS type A sorting domain-containing protein [Bacteroidota bacterium]